MKTTNNPLRLIAIPLATWFGCGYSPVAPGTAGSLAALLIAMALAKYAAWRPLHFAALGLAALLVGVWAAAVAAKHWGQKDPSRVVIDEVAGQWITLAGAATLNWKSWLAAFLLFRLLDIWKPFPVRQSEALPGGLGIMADNVLAGLYGALALLVAGWCNLY